MSLKMDLATYKSMFPSDRPDRLKDLENTIALITSIVFFRIKVSYLKQSLYTFHKLISSQHP